MSHLCMIRQVPFLNATVLINFVNFILLIYNLGFHLQIRLLDSLEEYTSRRQQKDEEKRRSRVGFCFLCHLSCPILVAFVSVFSL